jgi:hypothetical protein
MKSLVYIYSSSMNKNVINKLERSLNILKELSSTFIFVFSEEFFTYEFTKILEKCNINLVETELYHKPGNSDNILAYSMIFNKKNQFGRFDLKSSFYCLTDICEYKNIIVFNCDFILLRSINEINYGNFDCSTLLGKNGGYFYHILVKFNINGLVKYLTTDSNYIKCKETGLLYEIVHGLSINSVYDYFNDLPIITHEIDDISCVKYKNYDDTRHSLYIDLLNKYRNTSRNGKNLTIYVYYHKEGFKKNETNFQHFLDYGLEISNMDYIIVLHSLYPKELLPERDNIEIVYETNCYDFEAWYNILCEYEWYNYDNIFFINCSVLGPLNFDGSKNIIKEWDKPFLEKMKNDSAVCCSNAITLVGATHPGGIGPRCTSYSFCLKTFVIPLLMTKRISGHIKGNMINYYYNSVFSPKIDRMDTILTGEFGLSRVLLDSYYNITCLHPNLSDRGEIKMTLFMKNNFIDGVNRACKPCHYFECMYVINKNNDKRPQEYNFKYISDKGICHSDSKYNWNDKKEYYLKFGYAEEIDF